MMKEENVKILHLGYHELCPKFAVRVPNSLLTDCYCADYRCNKNPKVAHFVDLFVGMLV